MEQQEIQERNKQIALMLGGYKCSKISEQYELPKLMTFPPKGNSNLCHTAKVCMLEDMQFHADWNWLHEAAEKVYSLTHPSDSIRHDIIHILGRSHKEAVFIAVSDFATSHLMKKLKKKAV
jgi:hypothetical protein